MMSTTPFEAMISAFVTRAVATWTCSTPAAVLPRVITILSPFSVSTSWVGFNEVVRMLPYTAWCNKPLWVLKTLSWALVNFATAAFVGAKTVTKLVKSVNLAAIPAVLMSSVKLDSVA
jgi:hypothetical protein